MLEQIKKDIIQSMKDGTKTKTSILRLIVSECDLIKARTGEVQEKDVIKSIEKLSNSIKETIKLTDVDKDMVTLEQELFILNAFLPKKLTLNEIEMRLVKESIRECKNDGMAMGLAMKSLHGLYFDNSDVKQVVGEIRNGS